MTLMSPLTRIASKQTPNADFEFWKHELETMGTDQILRWSFDSYAPRLALVTSFESEGCVLLSLLSKISSEITIFCNEIDYKIQHYWEVATRYYRMLGLKITLTYSLRTQSEMLLENNDSPKFDAILCGKRRENSTPLDILGYDMELEIPVIAPLARWTRDAVMDKLKCDAVLSPSLMRLWDQ